LLSRSTAQRKSQTKKVGISTDVKVQKQSWKYHKLEEEFTRNAVKLLEDNRDIVLLSEFLHINKKK
jgi:hypothetical protein